MTNKRIKELEKRITKARNDYYNDQPTVDDSVYDLWCDELAKLDPENEALTAVGAQLPEVTEWKKVRHEHLMLSLNKAQNVDEFKAWAKECSNGSGFLVMDKLDGISISCEWKSGKLVLAATRGDSQIGENITSNVVKMLGVPKKLSNFTGHTRGEIVLLKSLHAKHFKDYSNPRNAASGIAKRLDGEGSEHLSVIFYTVQGSSFKTELEQLDWLKDLGLNVPKYKFCKTVDEVINEYEEYHKTTREQLDYLIDGLVVRIDNIKHQDSLGLRSNRPKGQIAVKFPPDKAEATLAKIEWQLGHTGRISPVAKFNKVLLSGAEVEAASIYNYSYIKDLGLDVGAKIIVSRSNDVIPCVLSVCKSTGKIASYPKQCPECQTETEFVGEYLTCPNKATCPAQKVGRLMLWINEQNILDWSTATIERVIDAGLVSDVADLYKLKPEQLEPLERMGKKLAKKLVDIMDQHRKLTLENLIGGLGVPGVATRTTKLIVDAGYDTLEKMYALTPAELESIPGFGSIRAKAFINGLKENKQRIKDILEAGVTIKEKEAVTVKEGKLNSASFCFTGKSSLPRKTLHQLVSENGGIVKDSVTKDCGYLVVADPSSNSSKIQKARKLGTQVLSEEEFMEML